MSVLTAEVFEVLMRRMREFGRLPMIKYSYTITDIYIGDLIDEALEQTLPNFNRLFHKGYLVPVKYRRMLEDLNDSINESM